MSAFLGSLDEIEVALVSALGSFEAYIDCRFSEDVFLAV